MTKIFLITGFLGAGKTTFLQNQLQNMSHTVGVLMNEFGKTSIDGTLVEEEQMDMIELTNGSIFCSCLKDHFIEGLKELIGRGLDYIFIESSGLADPSNMLAIIELLKKQLPTPFDYKGAICLIDAVHFKKEYEMMVSVGNQVKHSQVLIINKVDLANEETMTFIKDTIDALNPNAIVMESSYGKVDYEVLNLSESSYIEAEETSNTEDNKPKTITVKIKDESLAIDSVMALLEKIKDYCHRIKGIVELQGKRYKVDGVQGRLTCEPYDKDSDTLDKVVLISSVGTKIIQHIGSALTDELRKVLDITMD